MSTVLPGEQPVVGGPTDAVPLPRCVSQFVMRSGHIFSTELEDVGSTLRVLAQFGETPKPVRVTLDYEGERFAPAALNPKAVPVKKPVSIGFSSDVIASTTSSGCINCLPFHQFPSMVYQKHSPSDESANERISYLLHARTVILVGLVSFPEDIKDYQSWVNFCQKKIEPLAVFNVHDAQRERLVIGVRENQIGGVNVVPAIAQFEDAVAPYLFTRIKLEVEDFLRLTGVAEHILAPGEPYSNVECQERLASFRWSEKKDEPRTRYQVCHEPVDRISLHRSVGL